MPLEQQVSASQALMTDAMREPETAAIACLVTHEHHFDAIRALMTGLR